MVSIISNNNDNKTNINSNSNKIFFIKILQRFEEKKVEFHKF